MGSNQLIYWSALIVCVSIISRLPTKEFLSALLLDFPAQMNLLNVTDIILLGLSFVVCLVWGKRHQGKSV